MTQREKLLKFFNKNNGQSLTIGQISKATKVPRRNVVARVHDLRNENHAIDTDIVVKKSGKRVAYYTYL